MKIVFNKFFFYQIKRGFNNKFCTIIRVFSNFVFELVKLSVYKSSCKTKYF